MHIVTAPIIPITTIKGKTPTNISLSWTTPGVVVDRHEVKWERDISGKCLDVDEGSATITHGATSYIIMRLEESSRYNITVTATNVAGNTTSVPVTAVTGEAGEGLYSDMI